MHDHHDSHRGTDATDAPSGQPTPDPTDPDAEVWDVPTDHRWGELVTDAIGGKGVVIHERGVDVSPTGGDGPWILANRDVTEGLEANR